MSERKAKWQILLSMAIFGTVGVCVHFIPLPSSIVANVRGFGGTLFLLAIMAVRGQRLQWEAIRRNLKYLIPCGALLGFNWVLLFEAYKVIGVGVGTVLYYLAPVFVILISPLLFRERLTVFRCVCVAAAFVGMILTSGVIGGGESWNAKGAFLALGSAAMYAGIVILSKLQRDIPAYDTTILELFISALVLLPYNLLTVDFSALSCDGRGLAMLTVVAVVHTGFAYSLYFGSVPHLPAQTSAIVSYIDPVMAIVVSAIVLHEPMTWMSGIGAVLVLGSTLLGEVRSSGKKE